MIHIILKSACIAVSLLVIAFPVSALEYERHTTPEGHAFLFVPVPDASETYIRFVWKGGNGFLEPGKENVDDLGPAMLVNGGSVDLMPDELIARLDAVGGGIQLYSGPDALHGTLIAPPEGLADAAGLFQTVLAEPRFDLRWLRRFQRNFVENVTTNANTPSGQAWLSLREITMGDHPLRQAWNATPVERISEITIDDIRDWHQRVVTSDGVGLFVAGNADPETIGRAIDTVLTGLPVQSGREDFPPLDMHYPAKTILVHRPDMDKSYILIGGPVPRNYSDGQEAREIGVGVLGVSDQSRLFTAIRKELRAAYRFNAWISDFSRDHAMLYFHGEIDTGKLDQALLTLETTYETFRTDGISRVEFPFAGRIYRNRAAEIAEHPESVANLMVEAWLTGRTPEHGLAYPERAGALSRAETNTVIRDQFPPFETMVKIIVSPDRDAVQADCVVADHSEAANCR
jgi:predicted Zn-dependent peptidase